MQSIYHFLLQGGTRIHDYSKFSDKLDRLYITNESFDLNLIFSEAAIHESSELIAFLDMENEHIVPHYIAEPGNIQLIFRTVVQDKDSRNADAVGFRLLAYTDGRVIFYVVTMAVCCFSNHLRQKKLCSNIG